MGADWSMPMPTSLWQHKQPVSENMEMETDSEDTALIQAAAELLVAEREKDIEQAKKDEKSRNYQAALLRIAKERNTIIYLPTGSGKTFIALQLTKDFLHQAIEENKKIVFLANTVPLVLQQTEYFRKRISEQRVSYFIGDMNVDNWSRERWRDEIKRCSVMVMISQVFLDILLKTHIQFDEVCLLILDECHNATKNSAMSQIMNEYRNKLADTTYTLPKVLGLTATLRLGVGRKNKIREDVQKMEATMCAKAVTYHDRNEVLKHSTHAILNTIDFDSSLGLETDRSDLQVYRLMPLKTVSEFLDTVQIENGKNGDKRKITALQSIRPAQFYDKKSSFTKMLKNVIDDLIEMDRELGTYCTRYACIIRVAYLSEALDLEKHPQKILIYKRVITALTWFIQRTENTGVSIDSVSDKLVKYQELLEQWNPTKRSEGDAICGLVFVERRIMAQVLHWYTLDLSTKGPERFGFLKSNFILGSNDRSSFLGARMSPMKQREIISGFHGKEFNVLISTSVLEEGLNVPECNLVVRFDPINTFSSYVQSMGRGRKRGAHFVVFVDTEDKSKEIKTKQNYFEFSEYNEELCEFVRDKTFNIAEEEMEIIPDEMEKKYMFCPGGTPDGPKVTMGTAIQLVNQYCQLLENDRFAVAQAYSWWEEVVVNGLVEYRGNVLLPKNAVIRSKITGPPMASKSLAKPAAHLEACKQLYEMKALDEYLTPVRKGVSDQVLNCLNLFPADVNTDPKIKGKVGSKQRINWYPKKIPDHFQGISVRPTVQCKVYQLEFQLLNSQNVDPEKLEAYNFNEKKFYGIIIQQNGLEMIPELVIKTKLGPIRCQLKDVTDQCNLVLSSTEINSLKEFQKYLFQSLLEMKLSLSEISPDIPYLIAPFKKAPNEEITIFWNAVSGLKEFDNIEYYRKMRTPEEILTLPVTDGTDLDKYVDALVLPWYKGGDAQFLCVTSIQRNQIPCATMKKVWRKHGLPDHFPEVTILRCCQIGKRLSFVCKNSDLTTVEEVQAQNRSNYKEIPQFVSVFPFPASLYVQAKFLASVIHRTHRLLLAREIRLKIATSCSWIAAFQTDNIWESISEEKPFTCVTNCLKALEESSTSDLEDGELPPASKSKPKKFRKLLDLARKAREIKIADQNLLEKKSAKSDHGDEILDIHPEKLRRLVFQDWQKYKAELQKQRAEENKIKYNDREVSPETISEEEDEFIPIRKCPIKLVDLDKIQLESLDTQFDLSKDSGPSVSAIMEALTLAGCQDFTSLERLEVIGDSFLKYCATMHIYCHFPESGEGEMTEIRSKLICNATLCDAGNKHKLGEILGGGIFRPYESSWLPTGLVVPEKFSNLAIELDTNFDIFSEWDANKLRAMSAEELKQIFDNGSKTRVRNTYGDTHLTHTRVRDKDIADSVEALIGAYFTSGGSQAALHFMDAFELRAPNAAREFIKYGKWARPVPRLEHDGTHYLKFIPFLKDLEEKICYTFKDPWYVVQAFTHPSDIENRVTRSYEGLEFLGDAVLDFLVTNHIYYHSNARTPGELTDLRSALVNNVTFGSLAVRYGLHKYLLSCSNVLSEAINEFADAQIENGHEVTGHFTLLTDFETPVAKDVDVPKVLGDIFESLAGAVFLDCGMKLDDVWKVFYRLMKHEIDEFSQDIPLSPLREIYESYPEAIKTYRENEVSSVRPGYTLAVITIDGDSYYGLGKNKRSAKMAAAKYVIKSLKRLVSGATMN